MRRYKLGFLSNSIAIKCGKLTDIIEKLDSILSEIKNERGVYMILSDEVEYIYPRNTSKVIYIGKSDNFSKRINQHFKRLSSSSQNTDRALKYLWEDDKYMYMRNHGANIYFISLTETELKTEDELECEIMLNFYRKYQGIPVGNKSRNLTLID